MDFSRVMDVTHTVQLSFLESVSKITPQRLAFIAFFVFGDVLQIWIVYKNLLAQEELTNNNFTQKWKAYNNQSAPNISVETYEGHRITQEIRTFGTLVNNVVGLFMKCVKFSSNYYNVIWKWTDGHGWSPMGRACAFAALDMLSDVAHDVISALVKVSWGSRALDHWETLRWLLTRPLKGLERAVTIYLVAFFVGRSEPRVFHSIWMTILILYAFSNWVFLMFFERQYSPLPDAMNIVTEKSGYPKKRIILVKTIEPATGYHKNMGAKFNNFLLNNYIFVTSSLVNKIRDDQECAALVLREAGDWRMFCYMGSYVRMIYRLSYHALLGYIITTVYGNSSIEGLFKLESGVHPVVTLWVSWDYVMHAVNSILGLLDGSLAAQMEFRKDDYVCEAMQSHQKLFDAVAKQTEADLGHSSIYGRWHSRRFSGEPTIWERLDRMTQRYISPQ